MMLGMYVKSSTEETFNEGFTGCRKHNYRFPRGMGCLPPAQASITRDHGLRPRLSSSLRVGHRLHQVEPHLLYTHMPLKRRFLVHHRQHILPEQYGRQYRGREQKHRLQ